MALSAGDILSEFRTLPITEPADSRVRFSVTISPSFFISPLDEAPRPDIGCFASRLKEPTLIAEN